MTNSVTRKALDDIAAVCDSTDISLIGLVESNGEISAFSCGTQFTREEANTIRILINARGDVNKFLIEMSKQQSAQEASISETEKGELSYLATNPQLETTTH